MDHELYFNVHVNVNHNILNNVQYVYVYQYVFEQFKLNVYVFDHNQCIAYV